MVEFDFFVLNILTVLVMEDSAALLQSNTGTGRTAASRVATGRSLELYLHRIFLLAGKHHGFLLLGNLDVALLLLVFH